MITNKDAREFYRVLLEGVLARPEETFEEKLRSWVEWVSIEVSPIPDCMVEAIRRKYYREQVA
ncbi:hypothetical protein ES705_35505 [subsurface metagenome]